MGGMTTLQTDSLHDATLSDDEVARIDAYWRAANYLCVGMIYLFDNPLLRSPLIKKYDLDMMYVAGPGHGAPATLANAYLEGTYSEVYPDKALDEAGMLRFFRQFSFPGGIGSHCTPETPGRPRTATPRTDSRPASMGAVTVRRSRASPSRRWIELLDLAKSKA